MTLEEAVAFLAAHADRAEVVTLLKTKAGAIHHEIHQDGYNGGYGKKAGELTTATTRITELEGKVTKAEADLVEARKAHPELNQVHQDYQKKIADLTASKDAAIAEANGRVKSKELTRAQAELKSHLIRLGVQADMAEVQVLKPEHASRLVVGDDGELQVLQPGLAIPYNAAGDRTPIVLLAEAIKAKVPATFIRSGADVGSGDRGGAADGPAGVVAQIQKDAAARKAADAAAGGSRIGPDGLPKSLAGMAIKSS